MNTIKNNIIEEEIGIQIIPNEYFNIYKERNKDLDIHLNILNYEFLVKQMIKDLREFKSKMEEATLILASGGHENITKMYDVGDLIDALRPKIQENQLLNKLFNFTVDLEDLVEGLEGSLHEEATYNDHISNNVDEILGL